MGDQPHDVVDHDNNPPIDHDVLVDQRPDQHAGSSLEEATHELGICVNAVRQRIKHRTLSNERSADSWVVFLSSDQDIDHFLGRRPNDRYTTTTKLTTDEYVVTPLVDLIASLSRQNAELSAAAALWQERARFLGERLAAIEAGPDTSETSRLESPPADAQRVATTPDGRLRRALQIEVSLGEEPIRRTSVAPVAPQAAQHVREGVTAQGLDLP